MAIQTIAVVGLTELARSIAMRCAAAGFRVVVASGFSGSVSGLMAVESANSVEDAARYADLLIEAAAEEMEVKIELFTIFDKFSRPDAILASASPSFSIEEMASVTFCRQRCIGMRFPNDESAENRVELIPTPDTTEATISACCEAAQRIGREVRISAEAAHFGGGRKKPQFRAAATD